jgi:hypothetical protein
MKLNSLKIGVPPSSLKVNFLTDSKQVLWRKDNKNLFFEILYLNLVGAFYVCFYLKVTAYLLHNGSASFLLEASFQIGVDNSNFKRCYKFL